MSGLDTGSPAVLKKRPRAPSEDAARTVPGTTADDAAQSKDVPSQSPSSARPPKPTATRPFTPPIPGAVTPTAQWQFKVDLRKSNDKDDAWDNYPDSDSATIEAAYTLYTRAKEAAAASGKKAAVKKSLHEYKLNAKYGVHFDDMVQFRYDDRSRQRPVRRRVVVVIGDRVVVVA